LELVRAGGCFRETSWFGAIVHGSTITKPA
jgi:hypothetical protein